MQATTSGVTINGVIYASSTDSYTAIVVPFSFTA
jgi:hypothetical protein